MNKTHTFGATAALLMSITVSISPMARADNAEVTPKMTVKYADLNLAGEAGAHILYKRLQAAADSVCGNLLNRDPIVREAWRSCFETSLANAVRYVGHAQVTRQYLANHDAKQAIAYGIDDSIRLAGK